MDPLSSLNQFTEQIQTKLSKIEFEVEAGNGLLVLSMNGSKEVKSLRINYPLEHMDISDLEDLLCVAVNKGIKQAENLNKEEMQRLLNDFLPK